MFRVPAFVPGRQPIPFPVGTIAATRKPTWALYVNQRLNQSWLAYATPAGTKITPLGGVRNVRYDYGGLDGYVQQMQRSQCGGCD